MPARTCPLALTMALAVTGMASCSGRPPRRDPTGETFPALRGQSLDGVERQLPGDLIGAPALLLIGFKMETQFDLDRWILGAQQVGLKVKILELPTLPGLLPGLFAATIDGGMRRGIPREDWPSVVTIYGDAKVLEQFVGSEDPLPGRIVLIDAAARVVFFHDRGFSAGALQRLAAVLHDLQGP